MSSEDVWRGQSVHSGWRPAERNRLGAYATQTGFLRQALTGLVALLGLAVTSLNTPCKAEAFVHASGGFLQVRQGAEDEACLEAFNGAAGKRVALPTLAADTLAQQQSTNYIQVFPVGADECGTCAYTIKVTVKGRLPVVSSTTGARISVQDRPVIIAEATSPANGLESERTASVVVGIRTGEPLKLDINAFAVYPGNWAPGHSEEAWAEIVDVVVENYRITALPNGEPCCGETVPEIADIIAPRVNVGLAGSFLASTRAKVQGTTRIMAETPSSGIAKSKSVYFRHQAEGFELIWSAGASPAEHALRQIKGTDGLVDISTISAYKYQMKRYAASSIGQKADGVYQLSGSPLKTVTVHNPDESPTTYNRLNIIETGDSGSITNAYVWSDANQGWTATKGNGLSTERQITTWTNNNTLRTDTKEVFGTNSVVVSRVVNQSQVFTWATPTVTNIVNPGNSQPRSYSYWINPTDQGYRRIREINYPSGDWKLSEYTNGRPVILRSAFLNQPSTNATGLIRHTQYDYTPLTAEDSGSDTNTPRTIVGYLRNVEISRKYLILKPHEKQEIQCQTPLAAWNAADNLATITKFYESGAFSNQLKSIKAPDGTLTVYEYETNATQKIERVSRGQPNAGETAVIDGTLTVTTKGVSGQMLQRTLSDIISGAILEQTAYTNFDSWNRPQLITYLDGTSETKTYVCCGAETEKVQWETDRDGTRTDYTYDDLKRLKTVARHGITNLFEYDAAGRVLLLKRQGTDSAWMTLKQASYDLAGKLQYETNALGGVTAYAESTNPTTGETTKTITYDSGGTGGTRIELYARDGSLLKVTGTAARPVRYEYGTNSISGVIRSYTKEIKLDASGNDTAEWTLTYKDMLGRDFLTVYAAASEPYPFKRSFYNNKGQLWKQADPDGVTTLYGYNAKGELEYTALDVNRNDFIDLNGPDRITRTFSDVISNYGTMVRRTRAYVWGTNYVDSATLQSTVETSASGLSSWSTTFGLTTRTETVYGANGIRTVTVVAPDNSLVVSEHQYGRLQSVTRKDSTGAQMGRTTYAYDAHGRQWTVTDARTGATTYGYNNADQETTVTTPVPGSGYSAQTTTTYYNNLLQAWKVVQPDGATLTNEYYLTGDLKKTFGARTYPVEYTYDPQGRVKTLKTWQSSSTPVTTWVYDAYRGFPLRQEYDGALGATNTYKASGRLATRTWARGIVCTY
ncbi:MAG: RHS repeat protein, partial [Verrucomicrobia bacterium]|nr:RHS repeat protein [Verrucomicrobiota bacterium]